jgi:hypothetical protein
MADRKISLPPDQQDEYHLLETKDYKHYKNSYGWEAGQKLIRKSIWLSGNGCGVRQALFAPVDRPYYEHIAWEDHVKPVLGQVELEF